MVGAKNIGAKNNEKLTKTRSFEVRSNEMPSAAFARVKEWLRAATGIASDVTLPSELLCGNADDDEQGLALEDDDISGESPPSYAYIILSMSSPLGGRPQACHPHHVIPNQPVLMATKYG